LSSEWPRLKVTDLEKNDILLVQDGNHGEDRPRQNEFGLGDTAFIRAADMLNGQILFETADHINEIALKRIRKGIGRGGDIIFSHKGTVGKLAIAPLDAPLFVCSPQTTFWRTLDEHKLNRQFLYFFMCSQEFVQQWYSRKGETDMADYVSLTAQRDFFVVLPPIEEQRAIGRILGAFDERIELNRQMSHTLEATAHAIFKSWFVDFDPIAAKVDGRRPYGMNEETDALFPAHYEESKLELKPRGWAPGSIADLASYVNGKNFTKNATGKGRMVIRIAELNSGPGLSTVYNEVEAQSENIAHPDDLIFAWSGSLDVYRWHRDEALINQHIFKVIPKKYPQWFVHFHLMEAMPFFQGIAADKATTMGHIKREHISQAELVLPPKEVLDVADKVISPLYNKIHQNERESIILSDIRDRLLPKLLSGEIHMKQAEKTIEEVA
jgi:type I restriction enzyme, S subunit